MILAKDFEFMRRRADFQTLSFIPRRQRPSAQSFTPAEVTTTTGNNPSAIRKKKDSSGKMRAADSERDSMAGDGGGDDEGGDDESEEEEEEDEDSTFWPKLNTFRIYYSRISPIAITSKLVSGLERIRPGVAFSFQYRHPK